jgi:hypothetical protein
VTLAVLVAAETVLAVDWLMPMAMVNISATAVAMCGTRLALTVCDFNMMATL